MEICESQKPWKANQSHKVEEKHFFLNSIQQNKYYCIYQSIFELPSSCSIGCQDPSCYIIIIIYVGIVADWCLHVTHLSLKYSWIFSLPHTIVIPWIRLTKKRKRFLTFSSELEFYFHNFICIVFFQLAVTKGMKLTMKAIVMVCFISLAWEISLSLCYHAGVNNYQTLESSRFVKLIGRSHAFILGCLYEIWDKEAYWQLRCAYWIFQALRGNSTNQNCLCFTCHEISLTKTWILRIIINVVCTLITHIYWRLLKPPRKFFFGKCFHHWCLLSWFQSVIFAISLLLNIMWTADIQMKWRCEAQKNCLKSQSQLRWSHLHLIIIVLSCVLHVLCLLFAYFHCSKGYWRVYSQ